MAKKGSRVLAGLTCETCHRQNYVTEKNKINTSSSLKLKKYCPVCRKRTVHKEKKKLG
ncbi:50S ribosomal protein L33 [Candidatus Roizmanbacteria bacterium CG02_land_8_20_14_3_00_36_15]|uniref:Large ribosomal subunit protein bL33 n=2 Tax=Candidatus Roizmaniibacteriota TaxID=1752723 RepID=A0A2M8KLU1_9BACT|nr:MAG: 50S ribosomal protein L33 [Candidatus Roizmanbacteria bacterium CG03_land_8_20_14_0_80_36_21]PIV37879.1 MAG: 50S ribosomal protein L33 [Candidatus Roizmanbacteria bacterium CG02_land_8_20_14_3_00_36_15]PIY69849.1 MAG: 50S ribosomal protein L33 [Candidatus Roizmanbacteria bacterium CG_4_10_14_0_8_um_filter_36_36]PJA53640.1 MAG: 50S ribosomal protein L33 [Candidatus Roizmanbacteria bacterium CG_4_9_14_3_um_filter_36_11]PJC81687.1 MAG: 50S ribosomal protein L33 [Candidatus Roizmanbacteria 